MCRNHPESRFTRMNRLTALFLVSLAGCRQEMADQPRVETYESASFFSDGSGSRPQVKGTVARGQRWQTNAETTGKQDGEFVSIPLQVTSDLLDKGHELFDINCKHCHGTAGYGDGMVVQRGFPRPPSFHFERLRQAPDGRIFEVITRGHGRMPALGSLIPHEDRWSIVSYVRALQLSQHVEESDLTSADRAALSTLSDERTSQ
jgi:mono/diheme cytochrome c family protein